MICITPANGADAFISLVMTGTDATMLESEVYGWYTQTKLPTDISNQYGREQKYTQNKYTQDILQNIAGSILCHASIAEWCKAAKLGESSTERKERCARLTGDVAAYMAKVLNDKLASTFQALYVTPTILAECKMCHGSTITAKMECTQCHGDHRTSTTKVDELGGVPTGYELENNLEQNLPTWAAIHIVARYAGVNCRPPADAKASFNLDQRSHYLSGFWRLF